MGDYTIMGEDFPVCPYCRSVYDDTCDLDDDDGAITCGECEYEFGYRRNISVSYDTKPQGLAGRPDGIVRVGQKAKGES